MCCLSQSFTTSPFIKLQGRGLCVCVCTCVCVCSRTSVFVCTGVCVCVPRNWMRGCQKKSSVHVSEIKRFTPQNETSAATDGVAEGNRASAQIWQAPGCFLHTLLRSSCILESGEHRAAYFSCGGGGGERRGRGGERRGSLHQNRPRALQAGPNRTRSDPEKQPKQGEGCGVMTKLQTLTAVRIWFVPSYWNLSLVFFFSFLFILKLTYPNCT